MDADNNKIPIVEDDQGEGFMDPWEEGMDIFEKIPFHKTSFKTRQKFLKRMIKQQKTFNRHR